MKILTATDVDLISPFPLNAIPHLYNWMKAHKNIVESDQSPQNAEAFEAYFQKILPDTISYGVIDRNNALGFRHTTPIIGMVMFEPFTVWNYYIHIASNRRAWGRSHRNNEGRKIWEEGFMDQAIKAATDDVFKTEAGLLRLSAYVLSTNSPVKAIAKRLGWSTEGLMKHMLTQGGEPKDVIHYGLTRQEWNQRKRDGLDMGAVLAAN